MRVPLSPAVHGHIADSVRAGPAARSNRCFPVAPVIRGIAGGSASLRNDHGWHSSRSAHSPHNPSASAAPSPRDRISRQAEQRCCRPGERCDYYRFAGLVPVALIRDAAPGRAARAVHPLAAAPRCLRGPLTDLPSTCGGPGMYLAAMLAGGQISRSLAHYGRRPARGGWRPPAR